MPIAQILLTLGVGDAEKGKSIIMSALSRSPLSDRDDLLKRIDYRGFNSLQVDGCDKEILD